MPGDANDAQDVFVRDLQTGTTTLVSVSTNGVNPGNGDSFSPTISADGRYVLFHSKASNLAPGIFDNGVENLCFRDLQTATTYVLTSIPGLVLVSTSVNTASMTPDGHWVAFIGVATGISGTALYVWNSQSAALTYTNSASIFSSTFPLVSISPNGQELAYLAGLTALNLSVVNLASNTVTTINPIGTFLTHAGLQFSSDGRFLTYADAGQISPYTTQNTFRYDFQTGTNQLMSQNFNATGAGNGDSDSPAISPDGRWVAFRSVATNLVPGDTNNVAELFIYDTSNNATILVSVNAAGNAVADDRSLKLVFSADGQSLLFQSWASDVSSNDFNNGCDLFALDVATLPVTSSGGSTNSASVFYAQLFPAGSLAPNPIISWPLASGKTYQVLYKNNLSDPLWQNLPGSITFIGDTGYITDPSPPTDKRFYRIVLNP